MLDFVQIVAISHTYSNAYSQTHYGREISQRINNNYFTVIIEAFANAINFVAVCTQRLHAHSVMLRHRVKVHKSAKKKIATDTHNKYPSNSFTFLGSLFCLCLGMVCLSLTFFGNARNTRFSPWVTEFGLISCTVDLYVDPIQSTDRFCIQLMRYYDWNLNQLRCIVRHTHRFQFGDEYAGQILRWQDVCGLEKRFKWNRFGRIEWRWSSGASLPSKPRIATYKMMNHNV